MRDISKIKKATFIKFRDTRKEEGLTSEELLAKLLEVYEESKKKKAPKKAPKKVVEVVEEVEQPKDSE